MSATRTLKRAPSSKATAMRDLLETWVELAESGCFGADFQECERDCYCVVCKTRELLGKP